ncbi:hypothetical protein [Gracilibacillus sp. JCM 18860]|uniref:hypothetical protein n=1 Tax=Gracilibacillus sp. JCM 18860 TaxID=1306159 RepID=UPI0006D13679
MVKLKDSNIDFDCNKETPPYFQVTSKQRIRLAIEDLNISLIQTIIGGDIFKEEDKISLIFLSEYYLNNIRRSTRSRIGKIINITNWHETVVREEASGNGEVYVTIKNLNREDISKYCSAFYKGHTEAYISFFNDEFLLYVSSDVRKIENLKQNYSGLFNKYHENGY